MADNVVLNAGAGGDTAAADDIGGAKHQRVKLSVGADGAASDAIPVSDGLDTTAAGVQAVGLTAQLDDVATGAVTENQFAPLRISTRRALLVEGVASGTAQPVSGTVTANIGTAGTLALEAGNLATVAALSKAEDAAHSSGNTGVMALAVRNATVTDLSAGNTDGDYEPLQVSAAGRVWASATIDAALPAGTNAIGKLAANSGVTIGAVEIAAAQTLATVTTVTTVTTCSTVTAVTTLTGSGIAHDGADSGNPHKIGAKAVTTTSAQTLVAANDRTDLYADLDGTLLVRTQVPLGDLLVERATNTDGASTAFSVFDNAAGKRNYITSITVHNAHATTNGYIDLRDGTAGSAFWSFPLPATGGATHNFDPPLRQPTAATALAFDVSAAITTVIISVNGFKSKA